MFEIPKLPPGDYPFIDERYPLDQLAMIEAPPDLAGLIVNYAGTTGVEIVRGEPVEIKCRTEEFGDATFLVWWPRGEPMHLLVPRHMRKGLA